MHLLSRLGYKRCINMLGMNNVIGLLYLISQVRCARILAVFPTPSVSHQVVFRPITQELVKRGHEVVVITTDPAFPKGKSPVNLTEIDVHDVAYEIWHQMLSSEIMGIRNDVHSQMRVIYSAVAKAFEAEVQLDEVKDIIHKRKGEFDLLITEACVRPALAFSHIYNVPVIQISSFGAISFNDEYIGAASHPLIYPTPWSERRYNLTNWEKLVKIWNNLNFRNFYFNVIVDEEDRIVKKAFGQSTPLLSELTNNIQMLILNVHPIWIDNQPMPPNVIFMGGMHQKPKQDLPNDLQSFLDSSKNGVIYVSFGTNVIPSALNSDKILVFLNTLSRLPHDILLKWDKDELPIQTGNIKFAKWFPQADILKHPNIKLFITQGGLQSTDEAITSGVPMIGIPLFADQWYNVEKYVDLNIGLQLNLYKLTEVELKSAVEKIIYDKRYRENIIRLRTVMQDQPQQPLERAVWWIEHVLRHGSAAHLRAPTANMTLAQYIELDLIGIVFCALCALLAVIVCVLYYLWNNMSTRENIKIKTT